MKPFIYNGLERNCQKVLKCLGNGWTITNDVTGMWCITKNGLECMSNILVYQN